MKYTSLICAAALAAAVGVRADTTLVNENFNGLAAGKFTESYNAESSPQIPTNWTVTDEDEDASLIVPASIAYTQADLDQDPTLEDATEKSLELNTNGGELKRAIDAAPGVTRTAKSEVTMKLRLVASQDEPREIDEGQDVHAALFLKENTETVVTPGGDGEDPTEEEVTTYGLYAYSWDIAGTSNAWVALEIPAANAQDITLADKCLVALKVTLDYDEKTATYAVYALGNDPSQTVDDEDYITLGTVPMANAGADSFGDNDINGDGSLYALDSVAFRGTGSVDDLFVKDVEVANTSATLTYRILVSGEDPEVVETYTIQNVADWDFDGSLDMDSYAGYQISSWQITDGDEYTETLTVVLDEYGDFTVADDDLTDPLVAGGVYFLNVYLVPEGASTYVGPKSGTIQFLDADTDKTAYENAGGTYVPLEFTSVAVDPANDALVVGFVATVVLDEGQSATANFGVLVCTDLGDATTDATIAGSVTVTSAGVGTVTLDVSDYDEALFVKGITELPAAGND